MWAYVFEWPLQWDWCPDSIIDNTDDTFKYYINWYPLDNKKQCPICGRWVFGLLKDKQGNEMCIECYKNIFGEREIEEKDLTICVHSGLKFDKCVPEKDVDNFLDNMSAFHFKKDKWLLEDDVDRWYLRRKRNLWE
jgi:hypothetical protein